MTQFEKSAYRLHAFFVKETFISNTRLKWQKIKQKLQYTLKLNFFCLKIVHFYHTCYHPKLTSDILKNEQNTSVSVLMR